MNGRSGQYMTIAMLALLSVSLFFSACEEETAQPNTDKGYEYFPLAVGQETLYRMDSVVLRPQVGGILYDSVQLEVRETLVDTIRDLEDKLWYRGERYDRRLDSTEWRFRQTFLLRREDNRALRQEDNLEFVKMTFPFRAGSWDGHAAFDQYREIEVGGQPIQIFADWSYRYLQVEGPAVLGGIDGVGGELYDDVAIIEGADYENLLNRRFSLEAYGADLGLVYRQMEVFETQCQICCSGDTGACLDLPWNEKAEGGFIIRQWLIQ